MEVNRGGDVAVRVASGKGIGSPQPLYKLFLLSPWVLFLGADLSAPLINGRAFIRTKGTHLLLTG